MFAIEIKTMNGQNRLINSFFLFVCTSKMFYEKLFFNFRFPDRLFTHNCKNMYEKRKKKTETYIIRIYERMDDPN